LKKVDLYYIWVEIYGCKRLKQAIFVEENIKLSEWKVRRIMPENGLYPVTIKKLFEELFLESFQVQFANVPSESDTVNSYREDARY
jgi:hypothetical protein